jgi:hypothetical protein
LNSILKRRRASSKPSDTTEGFDITLEVVEIGFLEASGSEVFWAVNLLKEQSKK